MPTRLSRLTMNGGVAVLARVEVEHEGDQGALQPGARSEVDREAGAGDLGAALEVKDAECRPQVPVRLGLEVERPRLAHDLLNPVRGLVLADRDAGVGEVRQGQLDASQFGIDGGQAGLQLLDAGLAAPDLGDGLGGVGPLLLELADLPAGVVAPPLEILHLDQLGAPLGVELQPGVQQGEVRVPVRQVPADALRVFAQQVSGKHRQGILSHEVRRFAQGFGSL